jgi:hypothetical protein
VAEHAEEHKILWWLYGKEEDRLAWQGLAGIIGHEEVVRQSLSIANKKRKVPKGKDHHFYGKKRPDHSAKLKGRKVIHSQEHVDKLNSRFTIEYMDHVSNAIARDWEVVYPNGEIKLIHNMAQFCRENNLHCGGMSQIAKNGKTHHGFRCKKIA